MRWRCKSSDSRGRKIQFLRKKRRRQREEICAKGKEKEEEEEKGERGGSVIQNSEQTEDTS